MVVIRCLWWARLLSFCLVNSYNRTPIPSTHTRREIAADTISQRYRTYRSHILLCVKSLACRCMTCSLEMLGLNYFLPTFWSLDIIYIFFYRNAEALMFFALSTIHAVSLNWCVRSELFKMLWLFKTLFKITSPTSMKIMG